MPDVRFRVLGRVALVVDGDETPVRGRRERFVLALLLAARRQTVSADRLVEDFWGERAGANALASLQVAISRLRTAVEPDRAPRAEARVLVSSTGGYALLADPDSVDAEQFGRLVDRAHAALAAGDPAGAEQFCTDALALWQGEPFGGPVESDLVRAETARLDDLHLSALELRAGAQLALGRHALVTGELEALVGAHPFRERLWEHYALALYRCGRQGDALTALRRARTALVDELGVDPSPALRQLEADILAQADHLQAPRPVQQAPAPTPAAPAPRDPTLVGRDGPVEVLDECLRRCQSGQGETVVISGDAGIGKTRLVRVLAQAATAARVVEGRCHEADVSPAYWPWVPIVRELATGPVPGEIAELLAPSGTSAAGDAGAAALRTYDAVARLLAEAAAHTPLVVVLEDVHWADTASLQLLAYAAQALRDARVLFAVTVRAVAQPSAALQACLAALGRLSAVRIDVTGLSGEHVAELVRSFRDGIEDDELARVVAARTDGNPFFVIELLRLLAAENRLDADGAAGVEVPHGVQDVLRLRLARLPEPLRRLLSVAAVAGREFDLDVLAAVDKRDPDETLDLLDEAVDTHVVEEERVSGRYRFTHALVRETLAGSMSLTRQARLHAALAEVLEPRLAQRPDLVAEVAHHFVQGAAVRPELAERGVQYSIAAARSAESSGALDEALVQWEQALVADDRARTADLRRRYDVLLGLGAARHRRGLINASREALDAAVEIARELGDIALVARAATSFRGAGVWHWREFGISDPAMIAVLRECLDALPDGELRALVLSSLGMELIYGWRSEEGDAFSRQAIEQARAIGNRVVFSEVVAMRTLLIWGRPGAAEERIALHDEVLAEPLLPEFELYTRFGAAAAHLQLGDAAGADQQMTRCVELARRLRHSGADVPIAWWLFHRARERGDQAAAHRLFDSAVDRHRRSQIVGAPEVVGIAQLRLAPEGSPVPDELVELAHGNPNPAYRAVVAHALADAGQLDRALPILGDPAPEGAWDYASTESDCLRVEVLAAAGERTAVEALLPRIAPWGHEFAMYGSTECVGAIDYFVGRGLECLGDHPAARAAYERAAQRNRDGHNVVWQRRAENRLTRR